MRRRWKELRRNLYTYKRVKGAPFEYAPVRYKQIFHEELIVNGPGARDLKVKIDIRPFGVTNPHPRRHLLNGLFSYYHESTGKWSDVTLLMIQSSVLPGYEMDRASFIKEVRKIAMQDDMLRTLVRSVCKDNAAHARKYSKQKKN